MAYIGIIWVKSPLDPYGGGGGGGGGLGQNIDRCINFRSLAHQRKILNDHCVKNGDVRTSCCYAIVTVMMYRQSVLLGCTVSPVRPALLPFRFGPPFVESSTSRFSEAIPREGTESDRDLLRSGSPSAALKNRRT